jgi:hypothetical protein
MIVGVLVTEPAALLLVEVEREAYTVVNPTLADLAQSPYTPGSDKVSAILARPAASEIVVKQFPSLVKVMPALRAWQATYSWPFKITWAGKGGCPLILIVRWPQSGSRM